MFKTVKRKVQIEDSTVNEGSRRRFNCQWRFTEKIQLSMKKQILGVTRKMNDFDEWVMRRTVHRMYVANTMVTMTALDTTLKERHIDVSLLTVQYN
jgi:hypothetical protein